MNNKVIIGFVIVAVIVGGHYWYTLNENAGTSTLLEKTVGAQEDKVKETAQAFARKYQANMEIPGNLQYTYQLEEALVKTGIPVIFIATVDDIFRESGETYIRFAPSFFDFDEPRIFYTLSGCVDKVDQIAAVKKDIFGEYVVVAKITSIEKPTARVVGTANSGDGDVELELSEPRTFLATGNCLDLQYIENAEVDTLFSNEN